MEVLSPSNQQLDLVREIEEHKTVASIAHVLLVNPDEAHAIHWFRHGGDWSHRVHKGMEAEIVTASPALLLRFADLYEGLVVRSRPRLVA